MEHSTSWLRYTSLAPILLAAFIWPLASASKPRYHVYWNSNSKIFDFDNDADFTFRLKDIVELICPTYENFAHSQIQPEPEVSLIYLVSYESYMDCRLQSDSTLVQRCDRPSHNIFRTFVIRPVSPLPNGLEFQPGRDYYFISTSDGTKEGINGTSGGLCKERNMRMRMSIIEREDALVADPRMPLIRGQTVKVNRPMMDYRFNRQFIFADHSVTAQPAASNNLSSTAGPIYLVQEFYFNGGAKLQLPLMKMMLMMSFLWCTTG